MHTPKVGQVIGKVIYGGRGKPAPYPMDDAPEPVCECGHDLRRHKFIEETKRHVCYDCDCRYFTDARLAALRAEIVDVTRELEWCEKNGKRLQGLCDEKETEILRLTPQATRELPTREGWYWRVNDEIGEWEMVHVRADLDGNLYTESRDDDGTVVINLQLHGKRWSAEPIPMPVIEKEGEI